MTSICPVCEEGNLKEKTEINPLLKIESFFSVCDVCFSEIATPEQTKRNKEIAESARLHLKN